MWVQISDLGSLYFWRYILFKLGFLTSPETSLKHVFLAFSLPIFFGLVSGSEIFTVRRRNSGVSCVQISSPDLLYSESDSLRKLWFLAGPDFNLK
jgi:hypothetical protein